MEFGGEYEDYSDYQESGCSDDCGMDMDDASFDFKEYVMEDQIRVGVARVPISILQTAATILHGHEPGSTQDTMHKLLPRVWMLAIAQNFPETPLAKLRSTDPSLLPHWLLERFDDYQVRSIKYSI